ncbi:hypothetical protein QL285_076309 [Trifolium repens]|nr:hypothetical protein QL285_076309 [Trifolium repens]
MDSNSFVELPKTSARSFSFSFIANPNVTVSFSRRSPFAGRRSPSIRTHANRNRSSIRVLGFLKVSIVVLLHTFSQSHLSIAMLPMNVTSQSMTSLSGSSNPKLERAIENRMESSPVPNWA